MDPNPKRVGSVSAARYDGYKGATTARDYLKRGGTRADLRNDLEKHFVFLVDDAGDDVPHEAGTAAPSGDLARRSRFRVGLREDE